MTYNHFQIDSSGLLEAIEAAIPDPLARLGHRVELMFIHPSNRALRRWLQLYGWKPGNKLQHQATTPAPPA